MRVVNVKDIKDACKKLVLDLSYNLNSSIVNKLYEALDEETSKKAKKVIEILIENSKKSSEGVFPLCQDTGMAIVFLEIGQDIFLEGGFIRDAVNDGIKEAYSEGFLRKSTVSDPLINRQNTNDNLPAVIHYEIIPGDTIKISIMAKGFGSENQSFTRMMLPSSNKSDIIEEIAHHIIQSGGKGCPPGILGIGIGGTFESAAIMAKKALFLPIDYRNSDFEYANMENDIINKINQSGIGPMGVGGRTTILDAHILTAPTHIAGLPLAVNYCCHSSRHTEILI